MAVQKSCIASLMLIPLAVWANDPAPKAGHSPAKHKAAHARSKAAAPMTPTVTEVVPDEHKRFLEQMLDRYAVPPLPVDVPRVESLLVGAALWVEHAVLERPRRFVMEHAYTGLCNHTDIMPEDWQPAAVALDEDEYPSMAGQFAGIELSEFAWAR